MDPVTTAATVIAAAPTTNAASSETVTTAPPKAKRGRAAAGTSVFPMADLASAVADAKTRGAKFTPFTVKSPGDKPDRYFVSNHRNAVQHSVMTVDGYTMFGGDGSQKGGRKATDPKLKAEALIDTMDDDTRRALFAKYIGTNPALAAALPAAPPRTDTTPAAEFDAAKSPTPAATAPASGQAANRAARTGAPATSRKR